MSLLERLKSAWLTESSTSSSTLPLPDLPHLVNIDETPAAGLSQQRVSLYELRRKIKKKEISDGPCRGSPVP